jgi:HSP20 family protein
MARGDKLHRDTLHGEIEELFADLWQVPRFSVLRRGFRPNIDSYHTGEPHRLTVIAELPGVDPASLRIIVGEQTLLISGERSRPKVNGAVYQQMEIEYGPFQRQVRLPEDVDPERAEARYELGVVTISLPVSTEPRPRGLATITVVRG